MANSDKPKKPFYKKWWFFLIVGIIVLGAIGSGSDKQTADTDTPPSQETTGEDTTKAEQEAPKNDNPEITVSAKDLAEAFEANEIKANQDYKGKLAEISGTVSNIGESLGQSYIVLSAEKDFAITEVQCMFKDKAEIEKIANIEKGTPVTVIGKIDGKSMNVTVSNSRFK